MAAGLRQIKLMDLIARVSSLRLVMASTIFHFVSHVHVQTGPQAHIQGGAACTCPEAGSRTTHSKQLKVKP